MAMARAYPPVERRGVLCFRHGRGDGGRSPPRHLDDWRSTRRLAPYAVDATPSPQDTLCRSTQARKKEQSPRAARFNGSRRDRDEGPQTGPEMSEDRFPKITARDGLGRASGRFISTTPVQGRLTNGRTQPSRSTTPSPRPTSVLRTRTRILGRDAPRPAARWRWRPAARLCINTTTRGTSSGTPRTATPACPNF